MLLIVIHLSRLDKPNTLFSLPHILLNKCCGKIEMISIEKICRVNIHCFRLIMRAIYLKPVALCAKHGSKCLITCLFSEHSNQILYFNHNLHEYLEAQRS